MIDLHTHTTASDGEWNPDVLVAQAARVGLRIVAVTDHDTIAGLPAARQKASEVGIELINGVELSLTEKTGASGDFHALGLNLRENLDDFDLFLDGVKGRRRDRNQKIAAALQEQGIAVSLPDLPTDRVVTRAHFARFLVEKKVCSTIKQAFSRYLNPGRPAYQPQPPLSLEQAAARVHHCGGVLIMAHPVTLNLSRSAFEAAIAEWKDMGLDGLEVLHPGIDDATHRWLLNLCDRCDLLPSGGSDYHGPGYPGRKLGYAGGGKVVPEAYVQNLLKRTARGRARS